MSSHKLVQQRRRLAKIAMRICQTCPRKAVTENCYCTFCWVRIVFDSLCRRHKICIPWEERKQLIQRLVDIIPEFCPYTGERLIPGYNLRLDHKIPKCRNPHLDRTLSNLQWVSKVYNYAKWDMTDAEFAANYKLIYIGK